MVKKILVAYNFIINPETGRRVSVNGALGKQILKQYINQLDGGANCPSTRGSFSPEHCSKKELLKLSSSWTLSKKPTKKDLKTIAKSHKLKVSSIFNSKKYAAIKRADAINMIREELSSGKIKSPTNAKSATKQTSTSSKSATKQTPASAKSSPKQTSTSSKSATYSTPKCDVLRAKKKTCSDFSEYPDAWINHGDCKFPEIALHRSKLLDCGVSDQTLIPHCRNSRVGRGCLDDTWWLNKLSARVPVEYLLNPFIKSVSFMRAVNDGLALEYLHNGSVDTAFYNKINNIYPNLDLSHLKTDCTPATTGSDLHVKSGYKNVKNGIYQVLKKHKSIKEVFDLTCGDNIKYAMVLSDIKTIDNILGIVTPTSERGKRIMKWITSIIHFNNSIKDSDNDLSDSPHEILNAMENSIIAGKVKEEHTGGAESSSFLMVLQQALKSGRTLVDATLGSLRATVSFIYLVMSIEMRAPNLLLWHYVHSHRPASDKRAIKLRTVEEEAHKFVNAHGNIHSKFIGAIGKTASLAARASVKVLDSGKLLYKDTWAE